VLNDSRFWARDQKSNFKIQGNHEFGFIFSNDSPREHAEAPRNHFLKRKCPTKLLKKGLRGFGRKKISLQFENSAPRGLKELRRRRFDLYSQKRMLPKQRGVY
jgi:hypothetical protein